MTIDRTPNPLRPAPKPTDASRKREHADDLESSQAKKQDLDQQKGELIIEGPFKGLPLPLQKKNYRSRTPYVSCNEKGQEATLAALASNPSTIAPERRVHIGFSVWFNFDLMAVTKPSYGILCDYDNDVMDIYQGIADSLAKSSNRGDFVSHFETFFKQSCEQLFNLPPEEAFKIFDINNEPKRPGSWLASEESFQVIKNLSQSGHLLFLNLDIIDTQGTFPRIRIWLDENNLELDTLYSSNIIDWLKDKLKEQAYILNLKTVSTPNTRFIQAYAPPPTRAKIKPKHEPTQYLVKGVESIKLPPK